MAVLLPNGHRTCSMEMDAEGHRVYKIVYRMEAEEGDGPLTVLRTPGLPRIGSIWLVDNDLDVWAFRTPATSVRPVLTDDKNLYWDVEMTFSTPGTFKSGPGGGSPPSRSQKRCNETEIENPLLEPPRFSGGLSKKTLEATTDRFGNAILNSAHEVIRGSQIEFDDDQDSIKIEMNVPVLNLTLLSSMKNSVNDRRLWGFPRRCVKLANYTWEVLYYGQCFRYYRLVLEFETHVKPDPLFDGDQADAPRVSGFDRVLLDEGTKVLNGRWRTSGSADATEGGWELTPVWDPVTQAWADPDPEDPSHFIRATDRQGNPIRVVLNGEGRPAVQRTPVNRWWWISFAAESTEPEYAWFGKCDDAIFHAELFDGFAHGPFASKQAATDAALLETLPAPTVECEALEGEPGNISVEVYHESNFLLLGIPTSF